MNPAQELGFRIDAASVAQTTALHEMRTEMRSSSQEQTQLLRSLLEVALQKR